MNMLVVDDEYFAVKGITQGIEWHDLAIEHIYEAMDTSLAKDIMTSHRIDVLISDIEMPGENGLQLLEWVRLHSPGTEVIFLTGHANFSYAQKAIQLGSFDYVLKPIDHDMLKDIVAKAVRQIRAENEFQNLHETYKMYSQQWRQQLPVLVERFWQDLLSSRIDRSPQRLDKYFQQLHIPLTPESSVSLVLLSIERWKLGFSTQDEEIMEYAIRKTASEVILQDSPGVVIEDPKGNMFVIIYHSGEVLITDLQQRCEAFIQACGQYFHCIVSCYIGLPELLSAVDRSVQKLLSMEWKNVGQSCSVMIEEDKADGERGDHHIAMQQLPEFADWSVLYELGKKDELFKRIDEYFRCIQQNGAQAELLEAFYHGILHMVYNLHHRKGLSIRQSEFGAKADDPSALRSPQHLKAWACDFLENGMELLSETQTNVSSLIGKVQAYINSRLQEEELSREQIAASVYLNPAYLSRLFKKETGITLTDFIVKERMERAKELLKEGTLKISSIAEQTGYSHFSHFAKSFKKIVGMTPQEYRKQFHDIRE
ncbi:response regulator [Paenibacillus thalictri]|nr:response regulator [Paenibacillus thalictri]